MTAFSSKKLTHIAKELLSADHTNLDSICHQLHQATDYDDAVNRLKAETEKMLDGNLDDLLKFVEIFDRIKDMSKDERHSAMGLRVKGNVYYRKGKMEEAICCFDRASFIYKESKDEKESTQSLVGKIMALMALCRDEEAIQLAENLADKFDSWEMWDWRAKVYMARSEIYRRKGDLSHSLEMLNKAMEGLDPEHDRVQWTAIQYNNMLLNMELCQFAQAKERINELEPIFTSDACWEPLIDLKLNLAKISFLGEGNFFDALAMLKEAEELSKPLDRFDIDVEIADQQCNIFICMRRFSEAITKCKEMILLLHEKKVFPGSIPRFYQYLGIAHYRLGKLRKAEKIFDESRRLFKEQSDTDSLSYLDFHFGLLYRDSAQKQLDESYAHLRQAANYFEERNLTDMLAHTQLELARTEMRRSHPDEAQELLNHARRNGESIPQLLADIHCELGKIEEKAGSSESALNYYKKSIEQINRIAFSLSRYDSYYISYFSAEIEAYQRAVAIYLEMGQTEEAFRLVEETKSRSLINLIKQSLKTPDSPLTQEYDQLRIKFHELDVRGGSYETRKVSPNQGEEIAYEVERNKKRIETRMEEILVQIPLQGSMLVRDWVHFQKINPIDLNQLKAYLSENQAILEYYLIDGKICVFVIAKDSPLERIMLSVSIESIEDHIDELMGQFKDFRRSNIQLKIEDVQISLQGLYDDLFKEIREKSAIFQQEKKLNQIIVVPHGELHYLPFQALYDGKKYLIENYAVSYAPSAQIWSMCRQKRPLKLERPLFMAYTPENFKLTESSFEKLQKEEVPSDILDNLNHLKDKKFSNKKKFIEEIEKAIGKSQIDAYESLILKHSAEKGNIPQVLQEIESLSGKFSKSRYPKRVCFSQNQATVQNLKEFALKSDFIHLAMHGIFQRKHPLLSSLVFANNEPFTVHDVMQMENTASLITLSACETGKNQITAADELLGMIRGFFAVGAASLVVSLWEAHDASACHLMEKFYDGIQKGLSLSESLQKAQIYLLKKPEFCHPFYWSPFILSGRETWGKGDA